MPDDWIIWDFGYQPYPYLEALMRQAAEDDQQNDQLWYGEHPLIITKGISSRKEKEPSSLVMSYQTNRGGKLTLHLPGQLVFYPIFHLPPTLNINQYVRLLELMLINTLTAIGLDSFRIEGAPGIYTHQGKIASIGVRMSQKRCYHGVSLNVSCPLFPFSWLISCGDPNLSITSIAHHDRYPSMMCIKELMQENFFKLLLKE